MANALKISDTYEASSSDVIPTLVLSLAELSRNCASLATELSH